MTLEEIYESIPDSVCREGCFKCCTNQIQFTPSEKVRMGGYENNGICSHVKDGRCSIHPRRPFICRLYGTSEDLTCEGCTPERLLTREETDALVHEYVRIMRAEENS